MQRTYLLPHIITLLLVAACAKPAVTPVATISKPQPEQETPAPAPEKPINPFLTGIPTDELAAMKREAKRLYLTHWRGVAQRSRYVRQAVLDTLNRYHYPRELQLIPVVESSYNPYAESAVGATGLWQLMPITAHELGLREDDAFDGRRDIRASTHAAAKFLIRQYAHFGNWPMALAAYHLGPHAVERRLKRRPWQPEMGLKHAMLPPITKTYIRHIIGLIALYDSGELRFPTPYPTTIVKLQTPIDLAALHQVAGLPRQQIFKFNPRLKLAQYLDHSHHTIALRTSLRRVRAIKTSLPKQSDHTILITVAEGETLLALQSHYRVTRNHLRQLNPSLGNQIHPGQQLRIPLKQTARIQPAANPLAHPSRHLSMSAIRHPSDASS